MLRRPRSVAGRHARSGRCALRSAGGPIISPLPPHAAALYGRGRREKRGEEGGRRASSCFLRFLPGFSPFRVKPFLYVRSRGVAVGEQRWRRRGAPIRTRGAVQRSRVRWERGDNGATCTAHRPWPAKHAASSPHPPSVRSPECFIRGTVRTPARPPAACPTFRRTRRMILWMWLRRRRR